MAGPWQRALERAKSEPGFLDLTDSRFHQNGLLPDRRIFEQTFQRWLDQRGYDPDSRGDPAARQALSRFYAAVGWDLPEDRFVLTAGTSEAYSLLFSTLADPGDEVLLPRPGYPLFEHIAGHSRLKTAFYDQSFETGWDPDRASLEAAVTPRTKFVVVISPNNPTGQTLSAEALGPVAEVCRRHDLMLVVDEVFDACWEGPGPLARPGTLFPDVKTFTLNGISKRFGSPDLKLAWVAISGPGAWAHGVGETLELANDTFLSANSFSQFLLPELFRSMNGWQIGLRALLAENRELVARWMEREPRVQGVVPRGGIHGLWRFDGLPARWDDEAWAVRLLDDERLALHPGFFYDVQEPGVWLVYSLLKEPSAFREGLGRLERKLSSL
jgi:aspartate/methionine/tyrosine aminotransferase